MTPRQTHPTTAADAALPPTARLPLRRVEEFCHPVHGPLDRTTWPGTLPAVRALVEGVDLGPVTILMGENGSGKSTLIEAIASAWGFPVEGGDVHLKRRATEGEAVLARHLHLTRGVRGSSPGFFLRAETMHALAVHLREAGSRRGQGLLQRSHGEGFLDMLGEAMTDPGLWVLDEPESALSFQGQLELVAMLHERVRTGCQVLMATHSPILASQPGADLWEVGDWGLRPTTWEELEIVAHWRSFLDAPGRYHRHLSEE